ncbi:MAG: hypothetical protein EOO05_16350 [Chitinophagaceae bacterium]|nr:MAG: hypothetical protein EOO05_16350 [Chitinophagaceae bacterium]
MLRNVRRCRTTIFVGLIMKKRRPLYHIIAWFMIGAIEYTVYKKKDFATDTLFFVSRMVLFIALFYFDALILFRHLGQKKKRVAGVALLVLSAAVYGILFYLLFYNLYYPDYQAAINETTRKLGTNENPVRLAMRGMIGVLVIYYVLIFLGALFYWLQRSVRMANAEAARLESEKLLDEFEKIRLQNMFLRSQINPHFLHNTLNFLYAKSLPLSPELSEGILTLSNVMRYSLQQEEDAKGMVYLDKEIEHLENVIAIHQMRFSNNLNIDFSVDGDTSGVKLIPLVFITLVENGLKHGQLGDSDSPLKIRLAVEAERIIFQISNRKKTGPREISHGIGIENIRKRLEYVYKTDYTFEIRDGGEFYFVELRLPLIKN